MPASTTDPAIIASPIMEAMLSWIPVSQSARATPGIASSAVSTRHKATRMLSYQNTRSASRSTTAAPKPSPWPSLQAANDGTRTRAMPSAATARLETPTARPMAREAIRASSSERSMRRAISRPLQPSVSSMPARNVDPKPMTRELM